MVFFRRKLHLDESIQLVRPEPGTTTGPLQRYQVDGDDGTVTGSLTPVGLEPRTTSGGLICWGSNSAGQLGRGVTSSQQTAAPATVVSDVAEVAAGRSMTCIREATDGDVLCFGANQWFGRGDTSTSDLPTPTTPVVTGASDLASNGSTTCSRPRRTIITRNSCCNNGYNWRVRLA